MGKMMEDLKNTCLEAFTRCGYKMGILPPIIATPEQFSAAREANDPNHVRMIKAPDGPQQK